jgi:ATP-dependent DNA ligase
MARSATRTPTTAPLPDRVAPQLTQLVDAAPDGDGWLHEIKYDGYRMHARLDRGATKLLTRTGLDWTHKYPAIAKAVAGLDARAAYLDGELCGVGPGGITSFNIVQLASDCGNAAALVFFLFDLLYIDGEDLRPWPLIERKERLGTLLANTAPSLHFSDHVVGQGPAFYDTKPAPCMSKASSRNASMHPIRPAIAGSGARSNASTGRYLSSSAGASRKEEGLISARCCSGTMIQTES